MQTTYSSYPPGKLKLCLTNQNAEHTNVIPKTRFANALQSIIPAFSLIKLE
jgi:hypothetical protein